MSGSEKNTQTPKPIIPEISHFKNPKVVFAHNQPFVNIEAFGASNKLGPERTMLAQNKQFKIAYVYFNFYVGIISQMENNPGYLCWVKNTPFVRDMEKSVHELASTSIYMLLNRLGRNLKKERVGFITDEKEYEEKFLEVFDKTRDELIEMFMAGLSDPKNAESKEQTALFAIILMFMEIDNTYSTVILQKIEVQMRALGDDLMSENFHANMRMLYMTAQEVSKYQSVINENNLSLPTAISSRKP